MGASEALSPTSLLWRRGPLLKHERQGRWGPYLSGLGAWDKALCVEMVFFLSMNLFQLSVVAEWSLPARLLLDDTHAHILRDYESLMSRC